jgi:catechol 1,2-dioxygenase
MKNDEKILRRDFIVIGLGIIPFMKMSLRAADCGRSETNVLGPAYRKGAPARQNLCEPDEPGEPLGISGTVTTAENCAPVAGATLEVWQTNAKSEYDMDSPKFHLRGKFKSDRAGQYRFDTIVPGPYGTRAKHIHYLVSHSGFEPLITQCYFEGDERNQSDALVKPSLIIKLSDYKHPVNSKKYLKGTFNIALAKERPVSKETSKVYKLYDGQYLLEQPKILITISHSGDKLRWHAEGLPPGEPIAGEFLAESETRFFLREFDTAISFVKDESGRVVSLLNEGNRSIFKKVK